MMTLFRRLLVPVVLCCGTAAAAQGFENLDMLEGRVTAALGAGVGELGGPAQPIDRRLKLAACPSPASVEMPPRLGAVTVRCEPLGWRLRVPLTRAAPVSATAKAEPVIRKGDQVELTAGGAAFTVSTIAIAEEDGAPGDHIRLRTDRKTAAFTGEVAIDGRVKLPGFK
jgi:flagellar basal body P-ring formation protein FlgA